MNLSILILALAASTSQLKVAIFLTGTRNHYITAKFGTVADAFKDLLGVTDITAIPIHSQPTEQFPSIDALNQYDLVIVPGAAKAVEWELPWMLHLKSLIRDERRRPWVFGVCFGHQLACKAFGGTVSVHEKGYEVGVATVSIKDQELAKILQTNTLQVLQSHKRHVTQIPDGFTVWASNEHTPIQGVLSRQHKVFTCQFHPDYTPDYFIATKQARPVTDKEIDIVRHAHLQHYEIKRILDYLIK